MRPYKEKLGEWTKASLCLYSERAIQIAFLKSNPK
jgi:hypothetical protein